MTFNLCSVYSEVEVINHLKILLNGKVIKENQKNIGKISTKKKESGCLASRDLSLEDSNHSLEIVLAVLNWPIFKSKILEIDYLSIEKPNLNVLCIGVKTNLKYSKNDGEDRYTTFKKQEKFLFNSVRGEVLICKYKINKKRLQPNRIV